MNPITLALVGGIGGGCVGVPLLFLKWQKNNLSTTKVSVSSSTSTSAPSSPTLKQVPKTPAQSAEETNCRIVEPLSNVFYDVGENNMDSYFSILCQNASIRSDDERMKGEWIVLLPDVLFTNKHALTMGTKLGIKTETTSLGSGKYGTIFKGSRLRDSSVAGEWGDKFISSEGKSVATVSVIGELSGSNLIYLLFPEKN